MKNSFPRVILLAALLIQFDAFGSEKGATDGAFLDAPYRHLNHPRLGVSKDATADHSDVAAMIQKLTPVRSQASRGTCSIFSATAMLEAMMVIQGYSDNTLNLSEEWLEYLITRTRSSDGSTSYTNFSTYSAHGAVMEATLPYIGETWDTAASSGLATSRCGMLTGNVQAGCLLAHRNPALLNATDADLSDSTGPLYDPEFLATRHEATQMRATVLTGHLGPSYSVRSEQDAKSLLAAGIPVTLDIRFYYGAWNHREAADFNIGRDLESWYHGVIGYPEPGSVDYDQSPQHPAGHSILVVGYDDRAVVTTKVLMSDGTQKEFTYTGVYYIKNSWGIAGFGTEFTLDGVNHPGYGMITQKYAHEYGGFYQFPLRAATPAPTP